MFQWEMMSQNMDDGYPESVVRALSKGFLRDSDYTQLVQCNSLDDFKLCLDESDYEKYIVTNDGSKLDSIDLKRKMYTKLRDEMEYIMANAAEPLHGFLEQMMHYY